MAGLTDLLDSSGRPVPIRILALVAVTLVVAETFVVIVRYTLGPLSVIGTVTLASLVPALVLAPVLYRFLLVPLSESIAEREASRRRLQQYEDLVVNLPIGVFRTTPGSDGEFLEVNPAMVSMFEADSKAALLDHRVSDLHRDPENRAAFSEKLLAEGIVQGELMPLRTLAGKRIWGSIAAIKKEDEAGNVYFDGIVLDVTDRVETKEALERSEEQYSTLVEESPHGVVIVQDGTYAFVNSRMAEILGADPGELLGEPFVEYLAPEYRDVVAERYERRLAGETPPSRYEAEALRADGARVPVEIRGSRIEYGDRPADMAIVSDITERKNHEETLRALQETAQELMRADEPEGIADLVVEVGTELLDHPAGAVWFLDDGSLALVASVGWDVDERAVDLEDWLWECFEAGEPTTMSVADAGPSPWSDERINSVDVLPLGDHGVLAFGSTGRDGVDDRTTDLATILTANAEAALDRVEREHTLREQGDQLARRNEQLEFLHSLLRHDLLNGMQVITARADYLDGRVSDEHQEYVETIQRWCADMVGLIEKVRAALEVLTGKERPELEPVDLPAVVSRTLDRVGQTYPDVETTADVPADCTVLADDMLAEVLGNVLTNAVEHNRGRDLALSVTVERRADTVVVRVADDGIGIDDERKEAIFRRGTSGRESSGFGLYFVDTMVSTYGGTVRVEDNEPSGAVFVIELPAADADLNLPATDPQT